ncbi:MAG TPA: hypothetical protein VGG29_01280 [Caulobacteraceae bacterium]
MARVSTSYFLRALRLLTDLGHGDVLDAIICQAIISANTGHLSQLHGSVPRPPPPAGLPRDDQRKPISILALAESLGLPFETTRRHVNRLIKSGACQRVKGGVIVPSSTLDTPKYAAATDLNLTYVQQLVRGLRRVGLDVD